MWCVVHHFPQLLVPSPNGQRLLDYLFLHPLLSVRMVEQYLQCTFATASKLVEHGVSLGLLREVTGQQRNRRYRYEPYLALFEPSCTSPNVMETIEPNRSAMRDRHMDDD